MKVYKFGGASVKDADGIRSISQLLLNEGEESLVIVISAMGKTTNMLEKVVNDYYDRNTPNLDEVKHYHYAILEELFDKSHSIFDEVNNLFIEIEWAIEDAPTSHDYNTKIVSVGELLSQNSKCLLEQEGFANKWIDARDIIRTNNTYRNARIDWQLTQQQIAKHISNNEVFLTCFIGCTTENFTTTLGREGSDFTAAILGFTLTLKK